MLLFGEICLLGTTQLITNQCFISFANPHGNPSRLNSDVNWQMIHHSSQLIGAAAAFRLSQEESNTYLKEATHENWLRVRAKILTVMRFGGGLRANKRNDVAQASLSSGKRSRRRSSLARLHEKSVELRSNFKATALKAKDNAHTKANRWVAKMHGGNAGVRLCWISYTLFTLSILTLLIW